MLNITREELEQLITSTVQKEVAKEVTSKIHEFSILIEEDLGNNDPRSQEEIMDDIEKNRWTPPPGAKSSLELLREDRDR